MKAAAGFFRRSVDYAIPVEQSGAGVRGGAWLL
jgi:hypothetical protein